jgi:adenylate kinase
LAESSNKNHHNNNSYKNNSTSSNSTTTKGNNTNITSITNKDCNNNNKDKDNNNYNKSNNNNDDDKIKNNNNHRNNNDANNSSISNTSNDNNSNSNNKYNNDENENINTSSASSSNKRVIIGGIPGVGKTSIISLAVKSLNEKGQNPKVVVFGTEMFEEAKRSAGVKNRDELRKLSVKDQRRLQDMTASRIAKMQDNVVIVDTHIFVRTGEGYYYPGLPMRLLDIIKPTSFVMIVADATEIVDRRQKDTSRTRDAISTQQVQFEIDISKLMVATCSILTGAPFIIIANNDNKMNEAVSGVAKVLSAE